jgi:alpha-glucosidase/alpha-D-xyloside xylohydrolase
VFEQGATERKVYLPVGAWHDYWTTKRLDGGRIINAPASLEDIPLFVRAGTILPTGPVKQYVAEPLADPLQLTIYPGADGSFQLYDDDGLSFAYEKGQFEIVDLKWDDENQTLHYQTLHSGLLPRRELVVSLAGGQRKKIVPQPVARALKL